MYVYYTQAHLSFKNNSINKYNPIKTSLPDSLTEMNISNKNIISKSTARTQKNQKEAENHAGKQSWRNQERTKRTAESCDPDNDPTKNWVTGYRAVRCRHWEMSAPEKKSMKAKLYYTNEHLENLEFIKELFLEWGKIESRCDSSEILFLGGIWASTIRFL